MPDMTYSCRSAKETDLSAIKRIYEHYVLNTVISLEETPPDLDQVQERFQQAQDLNLPYLVAENESQDIVGYAYALPYNVRSGYRYTVLESVYLNPDFTGQGIGRMLLERLIMETKERGFKQMLAIITGEPNSPSYMFHKKCGFEEVGHLRNVGFKHDQWLDTVFMQKALG